jgi:hypothetical protein
MAVDYEQAVQALKRRIGARWDGAEADGRGELADALEQELGCSRGEAGEAIDAMIAAGTLRYRHDDDGEVPDAPLPVVPLQNGGLPSGANGTAGNAILPPAALVARPGYWQIGDGGQGGAAPSEARKGQVEPR